jgi:hypothetical protein
MLITFYLIKRQNTAKAIFGGEASCLQEAKILSNFCFFVYPAGYKSWGVIS